MEKHFPSAFVDEKTGDIKRLQTAADWIKGELLPGAVTYGIIGVKLALLAPFIAVAAPVSAAVYGLSRLTTRMQQNIRLDRGFQAMGALGPLQVFKLPRDKDGLADSLKTAHPRFAEDYARAARMAKLDCPPPLLVVDTDRLRGLAGASPEINAAAISRTNGKDRKILVELRQLENLTDPELRAVIAHEMTHLKLNHTKAPPRDIAGKAVNTVLNLGLFAAALFTPLPLLPVIGLIAGSILANKLVKSYQSRHRERLGDRGTMLLTGGGADLISGLNKIQKSAQLRQSGLEKKIMAKLAEGTALGTVAQVLLGSHPTHTQRAAALTKFESRYPAYCETQREKFNIVAAPPPVQYPAPPPVQYQAPPPVPTPSQTPAPLPAAPEEPAFSAADFEKQCRTYGEALRKGAATSLPANDAKGSLDEEELERFFEKKPPAAKKPAGP